MNQLGINFTNIAAQIVNFLILFWVLKKFVFQNVVKIIDNQKKQLKETDEKVKKIDSEVAGLEKRKQTELAAARHETENIINTARQEAGKQKKEIIDKAKAETQEMFNDAKLEIGTKQKEMEEKVAAEASDLAVRIASELTAKTLTSKDHQVLIKKALDDFEHTKF